MAAPTADEMQQLIADGKALPGGRFPIRDRTDLSNAIPDSWNADGTLTA